MAQKAKSQSAEALAEAEAQAAAPQVPAQTQRQEKIDYTSAEHTQMDLDTKAKLEAMPKRRIRCYQVPADSSDERLPDVTAAINGHVYQIKRGEWVEVPQEIANILAEAGHI